MAVVVIVILIALVVGVKSSKRSAASERPTVSSSGIARGRNDREDPSRRTQNAKDAPQVNASAARKAIDAECDALTPLTTKTSGRLFGTHRRDHRVWRELDQGEAADGARAASDAVETARVWLQPHGAMAVQRKIRSESADWSHVVDYCFRSDGSLARSESILVTVDVFDTADETNNGVKRLRTRYFDRGGREIGQKVEVRNLADGQPAKRRFADMQESIYRTVMDLPFAELLRRKR